MYQPKTIQHEQYYRLMQYMLNNSLLNVFISPLQADIYGRYITIPKENSIILPPPKDMSNFKNNNNKRNGKALYLGAACRYVELNPVRAKLSERPEDYRWSSARAHLSGKDDGLVKVKPMLDRVGNWGELLASGDQALFDDVRMHERTGRPLGGDDFMMKVSSIVGHDLAKKKPGPKRNEGN